MRESRSHESLGSENAPRSGRRECREFLALWALFTLVMMAVAFSTSALQTLLGAAGTR